MRRFPTGRLHVAAALTLLVAAACSGPDATRPSTLEPTSPLANSVGVSHRDAARALDAVLAGNTQLLAAVPALVPPGVPLSPFVESRLQAIAGVAVHDALNAIDPRFARYADTGPIDRDADPAAAALAAAHDAIVGAAPASHAAVDAWYAGALSALGSGSDISAGVAIGQRAAAAILARRATDGTAGGGVAAYTPGTNPGDYRFTFPFTTPPFDRFGTGGFADGSLWGSTVTPFVLPSSTMFRAPPPYGAASNALAVLTPRYTRDFDEVKALGCVGCTARTADQTEIAIFWKENSPTGWSRIARTVAESRHLDAWETARLLALVEMGEFDSYATTLESKYYYNFWRPVTAIALAGTDGNPLTTPATGWQVIGFPTPPVPDYPSAHSSAGGNAAAVIEAVLPGRGPHFSTTSGSLTGTTRNFASVADAAAENARSRIYIGFHFRHATEVGLAQGRAVGSYVARHALRPLRHGDDEHEEDDR